MQSVQQTPTQTKKTTSSKKDKKPVTKESTTVDQLVPTEQPPTIVQTSTQVEIVDAVVQDIEVSNILEFINNTSDKLVESTKIFKDSSITKDDRSKIEVAFKKFAKASATFQQSYVDYLTKQLSIASKGSHSKSGGAKKITDKEKSAIHKKLPVYPFLLSFMKLDKDTLVSRSEALTAITSYVSEQKASNPSIVVENDKRSFNLVGDLKPLFDGIHSVMKSKGLTDIDASQIKYTQIMQYMTHCFIKDDTTTTATVV